MVVLVYYEICFDFRRYDHIVNKQYVKYNWEVLLMKLAEALQERADLNVKIEQLRERLETNTLVQEGEDPAEDPEVLLIELDECIDRLELLMASINKTNNLTVDGHESLTQLIAKRDSLKIRIRAYRDIISSASSAPSRARFSEIKILSTVNVRSLQQKLDLMSKALRETDNRIQALNWTTELL